MRCVLYAAGQAALFSVCLGLGPHVAKGQMLPTGDALSSTHSWVEPVSDRAEPSIGERSLQIVPMEPKQGTRQRFASIFFVTTRVTHPTEDADARRTGRAFAYENMFTAEQANSGVVIGRLLMAYSSTRRRGDPAHGSTSTSETVEHFQIHGHGFAHTWPEFLALQADAGPNMDIGPLLYIHGYNTSFSQAASRAAQLAVDIQYSGPVIMFSWASDTGTSENAYHAARRRSVASQEVVEALVARLGSQPAGQLKLLSHSMGADLSVRALDNRVKRQNGEGGLPTVLVMVGPDLARAEFDKEFASTLSRSIPRTSIYCADDWALRFGSEFYNQTGGVRLGRCSEPSLVQFRPSLELIRVIGVSRFTLAPVTELAMHSYHLSLLSVLDDIERVINRGMPAVERAAEFGAPVQANNWWTIQAK